MMDPTQRFTTRVENYVKHRPGYPPEILDLLSQRCGLAPSWRIADVGSGTGILSELFLRLGATVYGIEPNQAMREAAGQLLSSYPTFRSVAAPAEATTLPDASVDLVTAGQAFHWFDPVRARREFARILRPGGWVALIWNERRIDDSPFSRDYEHLLSTFCPDYETIHHSHIDRAVLAQFFAPSPFETHLLDNHQSFDFEGLQGRLLSSSYAPESGDPRHEPMLAQLQQIFSRHQQNGRVRFDYDTQLFLGRLTPP